MLDKYRFPHCLCRFGHLHTVHTFTHPPAGEVRFAFSRGRGYKRTLKRCTVCGHFVSVHHMDMDALYEQEYVNATYQDAAGMRQNYERIMALPEEKSDNAGRVKRVVDFLAAFFPRHVPRVLDVGSGLGVFPARLKAYGYACTALDPDERAARHNREVAGVEAVCADFLHAADIGLYDVITFNKVLEHVKDPVAMLAKARAHLNPGGIVYLELPDGEAAQKEGFEREEFFIDHHHIFSPTSTCLLIGAAGFDLATLERLREPSGKFTLRAFLTPGG